ncbi:peroxiredoxin hyr1 [Entomortierella beljakovae]|nr:peroxiredoxin hyr1 [Entomortierella beljakovae]
MMHRATSTISACLVRQRVGAVALRTASNTPIFRSWPRQNSSVLPTLRFFSTSGGGTMFAASASVFAASKTGSENFFELKAKDKKNNEVNMVDYSNKVILVVNVASKCGFTDQYKGLEKLYNDYKDKGFVVIGFPCNQFGKQEPGTNEEIQSFCQVNYGVTFPVLGKIDVNGSDEDPVYSFLKSQKAGILGIERIKWNFEKFLVNKDGTVYKRYSSATSPSDIAHDIEQLLGSS